MKIYVITYTECYPLGDLGTSVHPKAYHEDQLDEARAAVAVLEESNAHVCMIGVEVGEMAATVAEEGGKLTPALLSAKVREILQEDGKLPAYAWPGGYNLYYVDSHSNVLCPACANNQADFDGTIDDYDVNYEDPFLFCEHCGGSIDPSYMDDDEIEAARGGALASGPDEDVDEAKIVQIAAYRSKTASNK